MGQIDLFNSTAEEIWKSVVLMEPTVGRPASQMYYVCGCVRFAANCNYLLLIGTSCQEL